MSPAARTRAPLVVAAAQPRCTPLDVTANVAAHIEILQASRARLVVFPELSLTGYELGAPVVDPGAPPLLNLQDVCAETGSVALVGAPWRAGAVERIATLRVSGCGIALAYSKMWLSEAEATRSGLTAGGTSAPASSVRSWVSTTRTGAEPAVVDVDGWRVGLAICKDTGVDAHTEALSRRGFDVYAAGVVHHETELAVQDSRGRRISRRARVPVIFASAAGDAGWPYPQAAGRSTIWSDSGWVLRRCSSATGESVTAMLPASTASRRGNSPFDRPSYRT